VRHERRFVTPLLGHDVVARIANGLGERVGETARFGTNPVLGRTEQLDDLVTTAQHGMDVADGDD
jgi:hypothetical protein